MYRLLYFAVVTIAMVIAQPKQSKDDSTDPVPYAPFQASFRSVPGLIHVCSGSILSGRWILTAAHCVQGRTVTTTKIVVGSYTINPQGVEYDPAEFHINPNFDPLFYEHDIALVRTATDIVLNDDVRVITLPSSVAPAGELVVLTGWRSDIAEETPNDMHMARKVTLDNDECETIHKEGDSHVEIHVTNVCARPRMTGCYCIIDAGAPLATEELELVGVFSISAGCGRGLPAAYTRVQSYRSWIATVTGL
ncbi:chymotrypsin-2-like [Malaya genurostris]|uniref:chymotrypsin-2-like n=1 Tax=Malaya genurostris TaxID=325434 RepID=UPI0026F3B82E|nr:chymotrypsin-2-like [Malaya genurostris]